MLAAFHESGKMDVQRHRRYNFAKTGASSKAQLFNTMGGISSGPGALSVERSSKMARTCLVWIFKGGISGESRCSEGTSRPASSRVEFQEKILARRLALPRGSLIRSPLGALRGER